MPWHNASAADKEKPQKRLQSEERPMPGDAEDRVGTEAACQLRCLPTKRERGRGVKAGAEACVLFPTPCLPYIRLPIVDRAQQQSTARSTASSSSSLLLHAL